MKVEDRAQKRLCPAMVLILLGSLCACILQTNFFQVKVKDLNIMIDDQNYSYALTFILCNASVENRFPVVVA